MQTDHTILEALDSLANVLREGSKKRIQQEMQHTAELLPEACSEEELAALAILSHATQRGNILIGIRELRASGRSEYRMPLRWDVVLSTLAEKSFVALLASELEIIADADELRGFFTGDAAAALQIGLLLKDPSFDPALTDTGYGSNRQYLRDCFDYIERLIAARQMQRGTRRRREKESEEGGEDLEGRYEYLRHKAAQTNPLPPLEELAQRLELTRFEWSFIVFVLHAEIEGEVPEVRNLLELTGEDILDRFEMRQYFEEGGKLVSRAIIELDGNYPTPRLDVSLNSTISTWLLKGGSMPAAVGASSPADDAVPFLTNEEYVTGWMELVKVLVNDDDQLPMPMRRRKQRQRTGIPAAEHPAFAEFRKRIRCTEACYPLEQIARDAGLDTNERIILAIGVYMALRDGGFSTSNAVALLAGEKLYDRLRMQRYFHEDAPLLREGLIEVDDGFMESRDFTVPHSVLQSVIADETVVGDSVLTSAAAAFFERRTPAHTLANAVLPASVMDDLGVALGSLHGELRSCLQSWGVESITASRGHGSLLLLFSGPAGTGKTFTAEAFAGALGRDLLITDAGKLLSKWFGESEQRLQGMFSSYARLAKTMEKVPVLLLNECDQLLMRRDSIPDGKSTSQTEHRLQNILLEQLERFPGVLIATTNLVETLDEAFSRRFDYKIVFPAPDAEARTALWRWHIPSTVPLDADVDFNVLAARYAFTGGQIAVAAANALRSAAQRGDRLTQADLQNACVLEERGSFEDTTTGGAQLGFHPDRLN
jgi:hypothetical protein